MKKSIIYIFKVFIWSWERSGEDEYSSFVPPPEVFPKNWMFGLHKRLCREGGLLALKIERDDIVWLSSLLRDVYFE